MSPTYGPGWTIRAPFAFRPRFCGPSRSVSWRAARPFHSLEMYVRHESATSASSSPRGTTCTFLGRDRISVANSPSDALSRACAGSWNHMRSRRSGNVGCDQRSAWIADQAIRTSSGLRNRSKCLTTTSSTTASRSAPVLIRRTSPSFTQASRVLSGTSAHLHARAMVGSGIPAGNWSNNLRFRPQLVYYCGNYGPATGRRTDG